VRLADGRHIQADVVIVGVGIVPNTQLARAAGLEVDNGIRVDAQLRSSDPDIYAAGDVANAFHPALGRHVRVRHWANALHQPEAAAKAMLGQNVSYDRVLAGMNVNVWDVNDVIQALVRSRQPV
jgi:3-phenylpropionate/trans-cinnamate dioxygenase ferredoxin reductase subunit